MNVHQSSIASDPRHSIGANKPPIKVTLEAQYPEIFNRMKELEAQELLLPTKVSDDETAGKLQDLVKMMRVALSTAESTRKIEKEPYVQAGKEVDAAFKIPAERLEKVKAKAESLINAYLEEKAVAERQRREAEAQRLREEAEAKQREAEDAERRRQEAEAKRIEEERRAEEAEKARLKAIKEKEEAERRAEEEKRKAAELAEKRRKAEADEAERRRLAKEQADKDAADKEARDAAEKIEREAHEKRMTEIRAQEEAAKEAKRKAEAEAAEAKKKAEEEKQRVRDAEEAERAAKREERTATSEANKSMDQAVRVERRADRMDTAANASEAEMSRTRGELGTVGSLARRWTWVATDRGQIPIERLRGYFHPDHVDAAVTRFMNDHRNDLTDGNTSLLPGVKFLHETEARVA